MIKNNYTLDDYTKDIETNGLQKTWEEILNSFNNVEYKNGIISIDNIGELYEIGLETINKIDKKEHGKYYTPEDVADLMASWFTELKGQKLCDVCCGTGNLILSVLKRLGTKETRRIILNGDLYLYDLDETAVFICKNIIGTIYGKDLVDKINITIGDFLDNEIKLPANCKVICNPPYFKISSIPENWEKTDVIKKTKEFYSSIMEKIIKQSEASVIITPYSFISGEKFYPLRKVMNNYNGFIVAFDNVPGNIFSGRKHGIFNSNSTNSVRAAITVVVNESNEKGFRCSPLIRFKNEERDYILLKENLEKLIGNNKQIVNEQENKYYKCLPEMESLFRTWIDNSEPLENFLSEEKGTSLDFPNSCRYFTVASKKELDRTGKHRITIKDKKEAKIIYCILNSSFCYWWWRIYDGGINFSLSLLKSLPIIKKEVLGEENIKTLVDIANEMQKNEKKYLVYKMNAGALQENIKFPVEYRIKINKILLNVLKKDNNIKLLENLHSNKIKKTD